MTASVGGTAISVYILLFLLLVLLLVLSIKINDRRISRIKSRYTLGQVPQLINYGYASYVQWVAFLWVTSVALLIAAAALDQWATWTQASMTLKFGLLGVAEGSADSVSYSKFLQALSSVSTLQAVQAELETLFHYLEVAGIMTLMWTVVALPVSCIGLIVLAVCTRQQSQSESVIQWWWSRRCYIWLAVSRCLNKLVTVTWFCLAGIPLIIDADGTNIAFSFGTSWYLALISSICIAIASASPAGRFDWTGLYEMLRQLQLSQHRS